MQRKKYKIHVLLNLKDLFNSYCEKSKNIFNINVLEWSIVVAELYYEL